MSELATIRKKLGLSQSEMGALLGLKKSAISMIENGKRRLSRESSKLLYQITDRFESWQHLEMPPDGALLALEEEMKVELQKSLHHKVSKLTISYELLKIRIGNMKVEFQKAEKSLISLWQQKNRLDNSKLKYLEKNLIKARKKYLANHPERQAALELESKVLKASLEMYVEGLEDEVLRGQVASVIA
ncbi:MAG: helix-turn-helix domain-containing protein [Flavobacteriales bacterium]